MDDELTRAGARIRDAAWLREFVATHHFPAGCDYETVVHFPNGLTVTGDFPPKGPAAWVVEGDLVAGGNVWLDDVDGLWITGRLSCENFAAVEAEVAVAGGVSARASVVLLAYTPTQEVTPIDTPLLVREFADGLGFDLVLAREGTVVLDALPAGATISDFFRVLRERGAEVTTALAAGKDLSGFFAKAAPAISPRAEALLRAIEAGASYEFTTVGGRDALRIVFADGSKQVSVLHADEAAALRGALAK